MAELFAHRHGFGAMLKNRKGDWCGVTWHFGTLQVRVPPLTLYFSFRWPPEWGVTRYPSQHIYEMGFMVVSWHWV